MGGWGFVLFAPPPPACQAARGRAALLVPASPATLPIRPKWLPETDSQPFGASCRYRRQPSRQAAQRPSLTLTLRVVCGNEKAGAGVLSGMAFLLTHTTRKRQRWRDGEGAPGSCLRRDVAAINKRHFCCERYRAATTPHKNKPNRRSRPNKHCLAWPVSARPSGRCGAQASGRCAGMQVYPRQGVAVRTGAAMPLLHLAAGGMGGR